MVAAVVVHVEQGYGIYCKFKGQNWNEMDIAFSV
jgi:hypothetical protein